MQVKEIMTKDVKYIDPHTTIREAAKIMRDKDIGDVLVGANDRILGVLTDRDIVVRALANGQGIESATVEKAMTPKCLYCFDDDSVEDAAKNMAQNKIHRLPVLNHDKRLVGIVSLGDIAQKAEKEAGVALHVICEHRH